MATADDFYPTRSNLNMKKCPTCNRQIEIYQFADHVGSCRGDATPKVGIKTKQCSLCGQIIEAHRLADHMNSCGSSSSSSISRAMKECPTCNRQIEIYQFADHVGSCRGDATPKVGIKTKQCSLCGQSIEAHRLGEHMNMCSKNKLENQPIDDYSKNWNMRKGRENNSYDKRESTFHSNEAAAVQKTCILCNELVADLSRHYQEGCRSQLNEERTGSNLKSQHKEPFVAKNQPQGSNRTQTSSYQINVSYQGRQSGFNDDKSNTLKTCHLCKKSIRLNEYYDHLDSCAENFGNQTAQPISKVCMICSEKVPEGEYEKHVNRCLDGDTKKNSSENQENMNKYQTHHSIPAKVGRLSHASSRDKTNECFNCSIVLSTAGNSRVSIPCSSQHNYCTKCIETNAKEFIKSKAPPVCHSAFCDYELTRYDVLTLPLNKQTMTELLFCVKNNARPRCPICLFYVECTDAESFSNHAARCDVENNIQCKSCHVPFNRHRMEEHLKRCEKQPRYIRVQEYVDFLRPRIKYPLESIEIRYFLDYLIQRHLSVDPHDLINTLADYGPVFPLDVPKRLCDVCGDELLFDDIFVFGCEENHKICYGCFAHSCQVKIKDRALLTCALCNYSLSAGEIKQLRIPNEEIDTYIDFQEEELFKRYAGRLIRCPRQSCKWAVEAVNPNEQFPIECRLCRHSFCSLCGQAPHYRVTCRQVPEITQRWFHWCNTERDVYWRRRAQQDHAFQNQIEQHRQQREATDRRNNELRERYRELLADEKFKAERCRSCPKCGRVVEKIDGCDSMICGQNYHGGDVQSGCGQRFNWSQAAPYVAMNDVGPQNIQFDLPEPTRQLPLVHENVFCYNCNNQVEGIRFDCIHCPSLIFCERCEQASTLKHSAEIQAQNQPQHIFNIITNPNAENN